MMVLTKLWYLYVFYYVVNSYGGVSPGGPPLCYVVHYHYYYNYYYFYDYKFIS